MRRSLVAALRCPNCGARGLSLSAVNVENAQEVREGCISCSGCGIVHPISLGVAQLLPPLDEPTARERMLRDAKGRDWAIELQRPYVEDVPGFPWVWPSVAANVRQGLSLAVRPGLFVLDVGPGTCWSTRMICERGAQAVAVDISSSMLRDGEAQFSSGVYFDRIVGTMEILPFDDAVFDIVFTSASIHHASNLERAFAEVARVLRRGGIAVFVNEPSIGLLRLQSAIYEFEAGMNEHVYRSWEYTRAANKAGLRPKIFLPASVQEQLLGHIPLMPGRHWQFALQVWRHLPGLSQRLGLWLVQSLFGLPLVMTLHKDSA